MCHLRQHIKPLHATPTFGNPLFEPRSEANWELICFINESQRKCQLYIKHLSSFKKTQRALLCLCDKEEENFSTTLIQVCQACIECPLARLCSDNSCCSSATVSGWSLCVLLLCMKLHVLTLTCDFVCLFYQGAYFRWSSHLCL